MDSQAQSSSWFRTQATSLDATQRDVLGLLALYGAANITNVTALCNAVGLRATPTRQSSTATVRPHLDMLVKAGIVHQVDAGYAVIRSARHPALRDAAARGRLALCRKR